MTAQIADRIIIHEEEHRLFSDPLKMYNPENPIKGLPLSTANWRGYVATWEISDKKLYLICVVASNGLEHNFFNKDNEKTFATWFSGKLRIPKGERIKYVHSGFASVYEYDWLIEIEEGIVVDETVKHNVEKKPEDFY